VSKFTITSKVLDAQTAFYLTYDTIQGQNISPVSANIGTTISVENLFYNTPARLNYLKTEKTEYSKILDYLHAVALSHPEVGFEFVSDGKKIFQFAAKETLSTRLYHLYSQEVFASLLPLESISPGLKIS
jgi:DNA mismatch repair protein MutL